MNAELKEPTMVTMFDRSRVQRADVKVLVGVLAVGLMFDFAVRSGFAVVAGALLSFVTPIALIASGRIRSREAFALVACVPLFGVWLAFRSSGWLIGLDVLAAALLLLLGSSYARRGSIFATTIPALALRGCAAFVHGIYGGPFVVQALSGTKSSRTKHLGPVVRGLLLVAPVFLILAALLASADSVFASLFEFDAGDLPIHLILVGVGAWLVGVLFSMASADTPADTNTSTRSLPATESLVALGAVVLLFVVFAITQLIVLSGGAEHVLSTSNLTYAEHARSGFFQLIAVAVITLAMLMILRSVTKLESESHKRWFLGLSEAAVVLTLVIVSSAVTRLFLYEDAYGLTMLRLFSTVFTFWIGLVFVFLGLSLAGVKNDKPWFLGASFVSGLLFLFVMNTINPEQLVVNRNVDRLSVSTIQFDDYYTAGLSEDAHPALLGSLAKLDNDTRERVLNQICRYDDNYSPSWGGWNASKANAKDARQKACVGRSTAY